MLNYLPCMPALALTSYVNREFVTLLTWEAETVTLKSPLYSENTNLTDTKLLNHQ